MDKSNLRYLDDGTVDFVPTEKKIDMVVEEYDVVDEVYEVYYNVLELTPDGQPTIDIAAVIVGNLSLDEDDIGHEQWERIEQYLFNKHNITV